MVNVTSRKVSFQEFLKTSGTFINKLDVWENNVLKLQIENAGSTNEIRVYGGIVNNLSVTLIGSIVGNGIKDFNIETYDYLKLECSTYDSPISFLSVTGSAFSSNGLTDAGNGEIAIKTVSLGELDIPQGSDYIGATYPNTTTEVYTYKNGGASGTTLKVVTVTYTNATKTQLLSVTWI